MLSLILALAVIGLVLWLVVTYVPMPEPFKRALVIFVIVLVLLYLIRVIAAGGVVPLLS